MGEGGGREGYKLFRVLCLISFLFIFLIFRIWGNL